MTPSLTDQVWAGSALFCRYLVQPLRSVPLKSLTNPSSAAGAPATKKVPSRQAANLRVSTGRLPVEYERTSRIVGRNQRAREKLLPIEWRSIRRGRLDTGAKRPDQD